MREEGSRSASAHCGVKAMLMCSKGSSMGGINQIHDKRVNDVTSDTGRFALYVELNEGKAVGT